MTTLGFTIERTETGRAHVRLDDGTYLPGYATDRELLLFDTVQELQETINKLEERLNFYAALEQGVKDLQAEVEELQHQLMNEPLLEHLPSGRFPFDGGIQEFLAQEPSQEKEPELAEPIEPSDRGI